MFNIFQSISTLPILLKYKIMSYVGDGDRNFGRLAGVCKLWWNWAHVYGHQLFSRKIDVFDSTCEFFFCHFFKAMGGGD
jgi:hypothetical protein